ncbi:MAG: alpha/beta hydrolase-fold protein [Bacteroidota bacterium]
MKKLTLKHFMIAFAYFLFSIIALQAQKPKMIKLRHVDSFTIKSKYNHKNYVVNIILPTSYSKNDSISYPVLYVLDGKFSTASFYAIKESFELSKEVKDVVIVTIDNKVNTQNEWLMARHYDYTPSNDSIADKGIANFFKLPADKMKSGGANLFLTTLENEIIPFVEKRYKLTHERGIFGHSLGGLFVGYCLLKRPHLFQKYSLNSPSFWWKNSEIINLFKSETGSSYQTKVFISAGQVEGDFMVRPVKSVVKMFNEKYLNMNITEKIFEDETHISVVPMATSKSLKVLYSR